MDELKIRTPFMKGIIGKILSKLISKKLGKEVKIEFQNIAVENYENGLRFQVSASGEISKEEFKALIKDLL